MDWPVSVALAQAVPALPQGKGLHYEPKSTVLQTLEVVSSSDAAAPSATPWVEPEDWFNLRLRSTTLAAVDAGMAGLIGALGGGFVGAMGAWGAALIAFKGARYQADRQSNAAHEQWLRQHRRDAYLRFIGDARAASSELAQLSAPWERGLEPALEQFRSTWGCLKASFHALELEAPQALLLPAQAVLNAAGTHTPAIALQMAHPGRTAPLEDIAQLHSAARQDWDAVEGTLAHFIVCCRQTLHEPASLAAQN
ncbi:hypothetical protein [Streptomyces coelicoflavus]|uniref:hypothetical protein n=1 Tax=Streptomyces coelicoflavus TaxID=285562 RepID=UPI003A84998F